MMPTRMSLSIWLRTQIFALCLLGPNAQVHRKNSRSAAQRNEGWFFRCNALLGLCRTKHALNRVPFAYAAYPLTRALVVEARAENLFDETVEAGISSGTIVERATPRTLWFGLRYGGG